MPELPETETIARDLHAMVVGATIDHVEVIRADVLRETTAAQLSREMSGAMIERVWRRAKLIVLDLRHTGTRWHLVVQPRFTGGLLIDDGGLDAAALDYRCITWTLGDGRALLYRDIRRLGTVTLMESTRFIAYSDQIGPEPLDDSLDDVAFSAYIRSSRQAIKIALMDQKRLAGVGNIYANEALWHAGIDPSRSAGSLSTAEWSALRRTLQSVLSASIAARGTSFRDYRDARGERGGFVAQLAAYGRAGQPCQRCGRRLVGTHAIDGRSTVFCPGCQA